jgi:hypothetical protein
MTEEEKDILQDKVLFEDATSTEIELHEKLMGLNDDYRDDFLFKVGIMRSAAKDFLKNATETKIKVLEPDNLVEPIEWEPDKTFAPAAYISRNTPKELEPDKTFAPAASTSYSTSDTPKDSPIWGQKTFWLSMAATVLVAAISTYFIADFRTANQFVQAELSEENRMPSDLFGEAPSVRGELDWRRAYKEGDYAAVIDLLVPKTPEEFLCLGLSKLYYSSNSGGSDIGQNEFKWILNQPDSLSKSYHSSASWFYSIALFQLGDCSGSIKELNSLIEDESGEYYSKSKKLKRKVVRVCESN